MRKVAHAPDRPIVRFRRHLMEETSGAAPEQAGGFESVAAGSTRRSENATRSIKQVCSRGQKPALLRSRHRMGTDETRSKCCFEGGNNSQLDTARIGHKRAGTQEGGDGFSQLHDRRWRCAKHHGAGVSHSHFQRSCRMAPRPVVAERLNGFLASRPKDNFRRRLRTTERQRKGSADQSRSEDRNPRAQGTRKILPE